MQLGPFESSQALRIFPDSALRLQANTVSEFGAELESLAQFMASVMARYGGVGLAATQVGILQRLIVVAPENQPLLALVNPVIEWESAETEIAEEGCLSLPGIYLQVPRPAEVTVSTVDLVGREQWLELSGAAARIVQHEVDHLDGRLIIDYVTAAELREARLRASKRQR